MTTETATAASTGGPVASHRKPPVRPYHKGQSTDIAIYANLRDGEMYLGDKPRYGVKTAALIAALILGIFMSIDPAGAFSGTTCQTTEGRC